jgi:hypothetical protein
MKRLALAGCVLAAAGALVACGDDAADPPATAAATSSDGVVTFDNLARDHTSDEMDYPQTPPVGGDHDPAWLNCNGVVYPDAVRDENAVHSLEHGAVWVTYDPDLPQDQVDALVDKVKGQPYTLMSPYPDQPAPVMATAWGVQLSVDMADDPALDEFLTTYRQGEQTPEPGAACDGGVMS